MLKIRRILLLCLAFYIALIAIMYVGQRSMMYHPDQNLPAPSATKAPEMVVDHVQTPDGHTNILWSYIPTSAPLTVMIFHGNAQNIAARDIKARAIIDAGYGVAMVEYRGFGGNPGTPTEAGLMIDSRAAITHITKKHHIPVDKMVFYGESLGSGVATRMASEHPGIAGLILEVPFDSTLSVAKSQFPFVLGLDFLMHDQYRSDTLIGALKMPKLIMVAGRDRVVPPEHARRLFDLAAKPKQKIEFPDGSHNNLYNFGAGKTVTTFLKEISPPSSRHDPLPDHMNPPEGSDQSKQNTQKTTFLSTEKIQIISAGVQRAELTVELATTPDDLARGLQHRTALAPDQGMLFIFPRNTTSNFWMKDTLIPLDILFLDQDGRIITMYENAKPMDETPLPSKKPARAALEMNAGSITRLGLMEHDVILSQTLYDRVMSSMSLNE